MSQHSRPTSSSSTVSTYATPEGLRVRGTVVVVPGRGETAGSYGRLGRRLAADAYGVRVLDPPRFDDDDVEGPLRDLARRLDEALGGPVQAAPLVLLGADTGAAALSALVARQPADAAWQPQALVLAGLPGYTAPALDGWDEELDARTRCPVQRAVLTEDDGVQRGRLGAAVPAALLDAAYGSTAPVPHLLLVGDDDAHADREALARLLRSLPQARLGVVRGVRHDVLNDLQHRAVAAEVVGFLEALREGTPLVPLVAVAASEAQAVLV
ncbi:MAG: hypothetical protein JWM64_1440 [Frankiales bacterium]|nr:hypothetical protein [Frankiales bacterium]